MAHVTNAGSTRTTRTTLIILATVLVLLTAALVPARADAQSQVGPGGGGETSDRGKVEKSVSDKETEKAIDYWTKERMKNAKPLTPVVPGSPETPSGGERALENAPKPDGPAKTIPGSLPKHEAQAPTAQTQPATADSPTPATNYTYPFPYTSGYVGLSYLNSYPNTTFGKIFFVQGGRNYVCSGTVVGSENKSTVWTAGHCVHGGRGGQYHTNVIFVPAYKDGSAPFGRWSARVLSTTSSWAYNSNFSYDLGAIVVNPSSNGTKLANRVGSLGLGFNRAYQQNWKATGYPVQYPFNGERMFRCTAATATLDYSNGNPATMGIGCNMNGGASGGGWAIGLNSYGGTVASVNSYKYYSSQPNAMYGPYQGATALDLYNGIRNR